jgi:hypothetical protein
VLIVDDNEAKRVALRAVLSPLGHEIVEADSAVAALRHVLVQDFAVILLDVCMPITDGFETAALIRQRQQSELTPIIFITGFANDEVSKTDRYAQGAIDFMVAPVPPDELRAKVSAFANIFVRGQELAARVRDVQASADRLLRLAEVAPIGIFQTDIQNRYVYTNPRWSEITGISAGEASGQSWDLILGPEERAALLTELAGGAAHRADLGRRFEINVAGSIPRVVLLTSQSIPDADRGIYGWVGTLADVTAEAGAAAAMLVAHDAALASSAMQKSFAASASHELRTPTTSILGFVEEIIENDALSEEDRGFLDIVYRNAQRLSRLIDDLSILDQAEIGASMMHVEPTDLAPLVERVMSNFSAEAQRAGVTFVTGHEEDLASALVDPMRFEQVLTNLVSNSLKFTPAGGVVKVDIGTVAETIEVSVADTGTGIDPADIDRIFDRFYRTKRALETAVKGSGLGLAIARTMIEAQDGQLRVRSTPGQGSTFTIAVPVAIRRLQVA